MFPWIKDLKMDASLVVREGASQRTADELKVCFIEDAIDTIDFARRCVDLLTFADSIEFRTALYRAFRMQSDHAEQNLWDVERSGEDGLLAPSGVIQLLDTLRERVRELNEELDRGRDEISGNAWFRYTNDGDYVNDEMTDPEEMVRDMEEILSGIGFWTIWDDGFRIEPAHPDDCLDCNWSSQGEHEYRSEGN